MKSIHSTGKPRSPIATTRKGCVATLLAAAAYGLSMSAFAADMTSPGQKFQLALEAQTVGQYDEMMALLRLAGEGDHIGAQEMLGMVLLAGPTLYGNAVQADQCEAAKWLSRALSQGSEVARNQWRFLVQLRHAPQGIESCKPPI
ncbi:MAG: sel1 repeat family protein [Advenella sp.]|uniref:sel1 repeat family protein n=1 Tax=Advenella sp. TaxID=1872388 RepID=UPI003F987EA5